MNKNTRYSRIGFSSLVAILLALSALVVMFTITRNADKVAAQIISADAAGPRPNIVLILADDLDLKLDSLNYMPNLQSLITQQGTTFSNSLVTESLCCPSRSTILRGQYVHNHQVLNNEYPTGGYRKFSESGYEASNFGVWLQTSGYKTAFLGKYLNGYPLQGSPTYVPPGWTEWYGGLGGGIYNSFNYQLNENGTVTSYGSTDEDYITDVLSNKAVNFIDQNSTDPTPFFLYVNPTAPHSPATPATRHASLFPTAQVPRTPSFNEADVSDKPADIRDRPLLNQNQINNLDSSYRLRIRSMQAVDEMIASIIQALQTAGKLNNTYVVFASDNGFHMGQHRMPQGKATAYEEDIVVPLIIRGPDVPANRVLNDHIVGNIDLAPTFADIAGVSVPSFVDGRSFKSLLTNNTPSATSWRQYFLIEQYPFSTPELGDEFPSFIADKNQARSNVGPTEPTTIGVRTTRYKYVEWNTGERELYDLQTDPYELSNIYPTGAPNLIAKLSSKLAALKTCVGEQCRRIEKEGQPNYDFDGDGKTDISVFRPSNSNWYVRKSSDSSFSQTQFGLSTDTIAPADFDNDGKTDISVYRASTGTWYGINSNDNTVRTIQFGISEDIPAPADFDGDGMADLAVFRPSIGTWWIRKSSDSSVSMQQFGVSADKPTVGDYDGDGKADIAVFRPSNGVWYYTKSSDGIFAAVQWGLSTDKTVPADYDGDGKTDLAVFRPSTGAWYVLRSSDSQFTAYNWGLSTDLPTTGDFDGDGKADYAIFRPSSGVWYFNNSSAGIVLTQFGLDGDSPVSSAYVR